MTYDVDEMTEHHAAYCVEVLGDLLERKPEIDCIVLRLPIDKVPFADGELPCIEVEVLHRDFPDDREGRMDFARRLVRSHIEEMVSDVST